jgi:hypothetical protein
MQVESTIDCGIYSSMRSVPPRGSGWFCGRFTVEDLDAIVTHLLPRGGTDFIGPPVARGIDQVRSLLNLLQRNRRQW